MFFRICFWFCGIIFDTPTIEKIIFLSSTVAIYSFVCFVGKDNENNSYWQIKRLTSNQGACGKKTENIKDRVTEERLGFSLLLSQHIATF